MRPRSRSSLACGLCASVLASPLLASAALAAEEAPVRAPPAVRRSGFTFGVSSGLALSSARGYPNDVAKIDVAEYEASTGLGAGPGTTIWIGHVLADWLSFGVGLSTGSFAHDGLSAASNGFAIRIETFPLFFRGGAWQDLGLSLATGIGAVSVERAEETVADGGAMSHVGVGVFFEPWRLWHFSTGPDVSYTHQFSRSLVSHSIVIGWRLALYGGP